MIIFEGSCYKFQMCFYYTEILLKLRLMLNSDSNINIKTKTNKCLLARNH